MAKAPVKNYLSLMLTKAKKPLPIRRKGSRAHIAQLYPNYPKASQQKTFYAAIGKAIASWQLVETWLYEVYRATTAAARPGAEACAFFSIPSFRTKLNLTSSAVRFALLTDDVMISEWRSIVNRAGTKSDKRNEIAHSSVYTQFGETRPDRKIYLGPDSRDPRDALAKGQINQRPEPLTLKRVKEYEKDFRDLAQQLRGFARKIPPP